MIAITQEARRHESGSQPRVVESNVDVALEQRHQVARRDEAAHVGAPHGRVGRRAWRNRNVDRAQRMRVAEQSDVGDERSDVGPGQCALEGDGDDRPDQRDIDVCSAACYTRRGERRAELGLHIGGGQRGDVDGIARSRRAARRGELQRELAIGRVEDLDRLLLVLGGETLGLDGQAGNIDAVESTAGESDEVGVPGPHHADAEKADVSQQVERRLDLKRC